MKREHDAIEAYRRALPPGDLVEFPVGAIDRLEIPFWLLTFYQHGGPTNAGSGYGTTDDEGRIGAHGELCEVVSAHEALRRMPRFHGSYNELRRKHGADGIVDPLTLCLEAGSRYTPDLPLQWVETRRFPSGDRVLAPIEWVACQGNDVGDGPWLITLITNGLGAGPTREHAIGHGLMELLQRDGNSVSFRALATGVLVEPDDVRDPETRLLLDRLDAAGVEVQVKLAATHFDIPNLYVVGIDREAISPASAIMALACGEAAHPDREIALRKALLEFAAARSRVAFSHGPLSEIERVAPPGYLEPFAAQYEPTRDEQRALLTMLRLHRKSLGEMRDLLADSVLAVRDHVPFSSLPTVDDPTIAKDTGALLDLLSTRLRSEGFDILVADFSPPGSDVHAVKVIVPGLEVETLSYHRIGERNVRRLLDRGSDLVGIGEPPAGAERALLTADAEARLGGSAWFDVAAAQERVGDLYGLYREPGRHAAGLISSGRIGFEEREGRE